MSVAVVIPCYRVKAHILQVIEAMPELVERIYVIDDKCPENSGHFVMGNSSDSRVTVIFNEQNLGVGGAVIAGYKQALIDGVDVIVKVDGDGQMDPKMIPQFVDPILSGIADYTKGNRFFNLDGLKSMPTVRLFGNAVMSFMNKLSSGYWDVFDPNNGYTAISSTAADLLPLDKISQRYFFESDMLFRLNIIKAVVVDIPMKAIYADEVSNLSITHNLPTFICGHTRNFFKRVVYNYYLRNFSLASIELCFGTALVLFGFVFGLLNWFESQSSGVPATAGTVMLSALPLILGFQMLIGFFNYDIASVPKLPISRLIKKRKAIALQPQHPA